MRDDSMIGRWWRIQPHSRIHQLGYSPFLNSEIIAQIFNVITNDFKNMVGNCVQPKAIKRTSLHQDMWSSTQGIHRTWEALDVRLFRDRIKISSVSLLNELLSVLLYFKLSTQLKSEFVRFGLIFHLFNLWQLWICLALTLRFQLLGTDEVYHFHKSFVRPFPFQLTLRFINRKAWFSQDCNVISWLLFLE